MTHRARAVIVAEAGGQPTVSDIDLAEPLGDEVLVRIEAAGVCHTDLATASGALGTPYPVVLGHEGAGTVMAVGPDASRFGVGDRVVVSVPHHCGRCRFCESGHPPLCVERFAMRPRYAVGSEEVLQGFGTGTFSTATVLRERSLAAVPDGVPPAVAAVAGCAVATGFGAVVNDARVVPGASVAVLGCGAVGASAVMAAAASGAVRVVAVDPNADRRKVALTVGASDAVTPDAFAELEPGGFDFTFEATGRIEAMEMAVTAAAPTGTVTLLGLPPADARLELPVLAFIIGSKRLIGSNMGRLRPAVDFPAIFGLYLRSVLPLDALVGAEVDIERAAEAFDLARQGAAIRVVLTP